MHYPWAKEQAIERSRLRQVHSGQNADIHSSKWRPHGGRVMPWSMEISSWRVVCIVCARYDRACGQGNRFNCLSSDIPISIFHNHDEVAGFAKRRDVRAGLLEYATLHHARIWNVYRSATLSSICRTRSLRDPDSDSSTDQCRGAAMRYRRRRCYKHAPDRATQSDDRKRHIRSL